MPVEKSLSQKIVENIEADLIQKGIKKMFVMEKANISYSSWYRAKTGKTEFRLSDIENLAGFFGVSTADFIREASSN